MIVSQESIISFVIQQALDGAQPHLVVVTALIGFGLFILRLISFKHLKAISKKRNFFFPVSFVCVSFNLFSTHSFVKLEYNDLVAKTRSSNASFFSLYTTCS